MAASLAVALLAACSGAPDPVEASRTSPEPTIEPPPTSEPAATPEESEEPSEEPSKAPIGADEPLYAPLPELTPDPDNEVPDDLEQLILDAFADAYDNEMTMYAAGVLAEEQLGETHFGDGYDAAAETLAHLTDQNGRDLSPDTSVTSVFIRDFEGGSAVVRECLATGPRTGLYDQTGEELLEPAPQGTYARDRMMELVKRDGEAEPRYRVTQIGFGPPEDC